MVFIMFPQSVAVARATVTSLLWTGVAIVPGISRNSSLTTGCPLRVRSEDRSKTAQRRKKSKRGPRSVTGM
jgi:hypothetical protein